MMPMDEARARELLEVGPGASLEEIHQARQRLKRLYGDPQGLFLAPAMEEFSEAARIRVMAEVEAAFQLLCRSCEGDHPPVLRAAPALEVIPQDGAGLRAAREAQGITLAFLAQETHVREDFLAALEDERFALLPPVPVSVRGFLGAYLTALGLPVEAIVPAYMARYETWRAGRR